MTDRYSTEGWRQAGYSGFVALATLDTSRVPSGPGTYAVLREPLEPVQFTATSSGGRFKGKDPAVDPAQLASNWVTDTETLYIGKATTLSQRLGQFRDFGNGRPAGHWGGRYIWQLADSRSLLICWSVSTGDPRSVEQQLIADFVAAHGARPFANLRD